MEIIQLVLVLSIGTVVYSQNWQFFQIKHILGSENSETFDELLSLLLDRLDTYPWLTDHSRPSNTFLLASSEDVRGSFAESDGRQESSMSFRCLHAWHTGTYWRITLYPSATLHAELSEVRPGFFAPVHFYQTERDTQQDVHLVDGTMPQIRQLLGPLEVVTIYNSGSSYQEYNLWGRFINRYIYSAAPGLSELQLSFRITEAVRRNPNFLEQRINIFIISSPQRFLDSLRSTDSASTTRTVNGVRMAMYLNDGNRQAFLLNDFGVATVSTRPGHMGQIIPVELINAMEDNHYDWRLVSHSGFSQVDLFVHIRALIPDMYLLPDLMPDIGLFHAIGKELRRKRNLDLVSPKAGFFQTDSNTTIGL